MTGDSCLARTVAPRAAAAVDHADTELIGHDGQLETPGFFVVVQENDFSTAAPTCPLLFQRGGEQAPIYFLAPHRLRGSKFKEKKASRHYAYLPTPVWGVGGERSETEGAASAGSYKNGATYFKRAPPSFTICHLPFSIFSGPLPPLSWSPSPRQAVGGKYRGRGMISLLPEKQGRPVLRKSGPTPFVEASFKVPQFSPPHARKFNFGGPATSHV